MLVSALFTIPVHIFVQFDHELLDRCAFPGPTIEHLILEMSEEAFTGRVVWGASLLGHRPGQTGFIHDLYPFRPAVMASAVGVDHRAFSGFECANCLSEHAFALSEQRVLPWKFPHSG